MQFHSLRRKVPPAKCGWVFHYNIAQTQLSPNMASKAAVQSALLSIRGLRRRRLGHIGPNFYDQGKDKWGRKKADGAANLLAPGTKAIRSPRASVSQAGGSQFIRRNGRESVSSVNTNRTRCHLNGILPQPIASSTFCTNGLKVSASNNKLTMETHGDEIPAGGREKDRGYSSDLIVLLDLDECLIHSQFLSDQQYDKYRQAEVRPTGNSPFFSSEEAESIISTTCESFRISLPDGDLVHINKRPNLDLFLKEITYRFETYIFTAAMEVYASPVLNALDPKGDMFCGRFYRNHCRFHPELGVYAKDLFDVLQKERRVSSSLNHLGSDAQLSEDQKAFDERRVVLVDNNPLSFLPNPSNGILVSSFYDDPKDDTLEAVVELLNELDQSHDVRPILDERFGLKDALNDVVKGTSWK